MILIRTSNRVLEILKSHSLGCFLSQELFCVSFPKIWSCLNVKKKFGLVPRVCGSSYIALSSHPFSTLRSISRNYGTTLHTITKTTRGRGLQVGHQKFITTIHSCNGCHILNLLPRSCKNFYAYSLLRCLRKTDVP